MTKPFAVLPPPGSPVSLATWLAEVATLARVTWDPPPFPKDAPRGNGRPVLVVPGFCAPDLSTARLREFLKRQDFNAYSWELGVNIGPTKTIMAGLERRLADVAERHGVAPALIGQSLGGTISRQVAKRRPDLVSHLVTLVSPIRTPVPTPIAPLAHCAAMVWEEDARHALDKLHEPPPVPLTAIVNPKDGLLDWRCCRPDPAPNVEIIEIAGSHTTMGSNPDVQRIVATRLAPKAP
jgi:pimeloyl-ACP methyl ester carboxylesterase